MTFDRPCVGTLLIAHKGVIRCSMQEWQEHPDVLYATPLAMPGQKVVGPQDGMPTWVCEFMVVKPTVEEAIEFVTAVEKGLQVPIE